MSIDRDIAIAYLLDELDGADRERFENEISADPQLRAAVDELRPVVTRLEGMPDEAWELPEPPPLDLARATAAPDEEPAPLAEREAAQARVERERRSVGQSFWARLAGGLAAGAALLLVGFFIGAGTGGEDGGDAPSPQPGPALALSSLGEGPPSAEGQVQMVSSEGDQMRLDVSGLKPSSRGEFYEAWLLGADGELIALGSFRVGPEGERSVELPLPVDPSTFKYFDVSIQPENGDPDHSGRSVLRGLTTY